MNARARLLLAITLLGALLLGSLVMMSDALQNSERFGRIYSLLLVANTAGLLCFAAIIGVNIRRLWRELSTAAPGARLKRRMTLMFVGIAVPPLLIVYGFSVDVVKRGIDNWFDVAIEEALGNAMDLSRASFDLRMRDLLKQTQQLAEGLNQPARSSVRLNFEELDLPDNTIVVNEPPDAPAVDLDELRHTSGAEELTLLTGKGAVVASTELSPSLASETVLLQLRQKENYIGLDPVHDNRLSIRVAVNVPGAGIGNDTRVLEALYPVAEHLTAMAGKVEQAFVKYKELAYLRQQLKVGFILTLTLVLLFSLLGAVWLAFYSAENLAAPIRDLVQGTRAVAAGDYNTTLLVDRRDDMGALVASFNEMTQRLASARDEARQSREEVEAQRLYLEALVGRLSTGVLTIDAERHLRTANAAASLILGVSGSLLGGGTVDDLGRQVPHAQPFVDNLLRHLQAGDREWQEQITLFGLSGHRLLMCRGASLTAAHEHGGYVIVFDDVTALVQGQRDAAWSEVARRLAHEIKNPLTPIQLAAERLRQKYLRTLPAAEIETLERLTTTIIQQVETMKGMVNTFSDYARNPITRYESINLNRLIDEVLDLYRSDDPRLTLATELDNDLPALHADPNRLRQVMNNLINNAIEAQSEQSQCQVKVSTRLLREADAAVVELRVTDRGPGVPAEMLGQVFEPYVSNKPKGSGLGLPIVKKIIEEHNGKVWMENNPDGGAAAVIRLPLSLTAAASPDSSLAIKNARSSVA